MQKELVLDALQITVREFIIACGNPQMKTEKWLSMKYLEVLYGGSIFILQSLTISNMRKCQGIKLSQLHKAKTCWTENLLV